MPFLGRRGDIGQDVEAAQAVRQAIGPDRLLLIDANQAWGTPAAIVAGRALEGCSDAGSRSRSTVTTW